VALAACQPTVDNWKPADKQTYFPIAIDGKTLYLQLALTPSEQQKGLMYRDSMEVDHGMLFIFERPERRAFWMRNTSIPLDLGYFDASGRLLEVRKLYPFNENTVPSASNKVLIAVETNRGWFEANEIPPGAQIDMKAVQEAVAHRGHSNPYLQP
jgi:uncharacterized membrane protein (UPF0127 family)